MDHNIPKNLYKVILRGGSNWSDEHRVIVLVRELLRSNKDSRGINFNNWFDVLGKETEICKSGFKSFTLETCPKTINLREELAKSGVKVPPKFSMSYPIRLRRTEAMEKVLCEKEKEQERKRGLNLGSLTNQRHVRELKYQWFYFKKRTENRKLWEKYNRICYDLIHKDIAKQREIGVKFGKLAFNYVGENKNGELIIYKIDI